MNAFQSRSLKWFGQIKNFGSCLNVNVKALNCLQYFIHFNFFITRYFILSINIIWEYKKLRKSWRGLKIENKLRGSLLQIKREKL